MSTINAQLLQSSATIIKDLYLSPQQASNERRFKRISSPVTLVLSLLAFGGKEAVFL